MKQILLLTFGLIMLANSSFSQDNCPCCTEYHKQFDFWVGDWLVYDTSGKQIGENTIIKLEDNCIISEHWRGVGGSTGRSYNYFDQADSTWNQVWIDNQGTNLVLKGNAEPDKMTLKSKLIKGQKVDFYYNRITWTKKDNGSVTQVWEILDKKNKLLSETFRGIYKRK